MNGTITLKDDQNSIEWPRGGATITDGNKHTPIDLEGLEAWRVNISVTLRLYLVF